ncbi:ABC transporter ATP-binding protein [Anaeroarcus burkinensis]|uniref:ABC transporter ATP-binding protein n=1 Tax=Anaeroarcus burkinensis TaxID=82376 RepID=UPI000422EF32|nr:ABC transporter ATP-binding protein [Anaeroarcus burkinensis]
MLQLENVSLRYDENTEALALEDVSFHVAPGELVAIVGPSGCGKSTTLSLLAGLAQANVGSIKLRGEPITGPGLDRAVVFQEYSLFPWMTAEENIRFALEQVGIKDKKKAKDFLEQVGIAEAAHQYPSALSGGMRQRVAIARAFALGAPVYLLDEPFGAVDARNRIRLQELLLRLWQEDSEKKTIVIVTHDIEEAIYLADRIIVFTPGPGKVLKEVEVPYERPRNRYHLTRDKSYIALRNELLALLQNDLLDELTIVEGGSGI